MYNYPPVVPSGGRNLHLDHVGTILIVRRAFPQLLHGVKVRAANMQP